MLIVAVCPSGRRRRVYVGCERVLSWGNWERGALTREGGRFGCVESAERVLRASLAAGARTVRRRVAPRHAVGVRGTRSGRVCFRSGPARHGARRSAGAQVAGAVAGSTQIPVTITLRPRDPAARADYATEVSTPGRRGHRGHRGARRDRAGVRHREHARHGDRQGRQGVPEGFRLRAPGARTVQPTISERR